MKTIYTLAVLSSAALLVGCNNDDKDTPAISDKVIEFTATAPRASRAVTTTDNIDNFSVWAFSNKTLFMDNVKVDKKDSKWTYSPTMYWPAENSVNFYSISPQVKQTTMIGDRGNVDIRNYVNDGMTDFLYAVNMDEFAPAKGTAKQVQVNFRHGLSQLQFKLRRNSDSTHKPFRVGVKGVEITQLYTKGDFKFPDQTTLHNEVTALGTWSEIGQAESAMIFQKTDSVDLTDDYAVFNSTGYMFVTPQQLIPTSKEGYIGCYVRVLCAIYDEDSNVKLWPSSSDPNYDKTTGMGYLYFPLDQTGVTEWQIGKLYVYNLTIGLSASSTAIEFEVTVDDYNDFEMAPDFE